MQPGAIIAGRLSLDPGALADAQFPPDPNTRPCTINVHLLGHSTGAYLIMDAFANAAKRGIPDKAVHADCSACLASKNPGQSVFVGTFNHSWHSAAPEFALDLALTLEGAIDRQAIPTRRVDQGRIVLIAGQKRPEFQAGSDEDRPTPG